MDARLVTAACAAVASWAVFFHRQKVRGDYALVFYAVAGTLLYWYLRATDVSAASSPLATTASIYAVYFSSLIAVTLTYRLSPWHPLTSYPGPLLCKLTGLWLAYVSFTGKRHHYLDRWHARYGPFVRVGPNIVTVNSPTVATIYNNSIKSELYRIADRTINHVSLFFKPYTKKGHRERRRIWGGMFTTAGLAEVLPSIEHRTWQLIKVLDRRQEARGDGLVDVGEALGHWAYDVMGDVVFGGINEFNFLEKGDSGKVMYSNKLATTLMDSVGVTPWLLDILWHLPATKDMHASRDLASSMMRTRMKAGKALEYRDLASYWMEGGIPEHELELDAVVAMTAGSDTTASNLTFAIYFLTANPHYAQKLRQELDTAFPNPLGTLDMNVLQALPLLNGVINETLRLATPYYMPREVPAGGLVLDGKYIPEGTDVSIATNAQHLSEENFYPDPLSFHPTRWIPGGLGPDTRTNKNMLVSFGLGEHACIGKPLAYQEMRHTLSRLVLTCDFAFPKGFDVQGFPLGMQNARTVFFEIPLVIGVTRRPGVVGIEKAYE
ncbi:cytochrome P450 [Trametes maxima]|nr:cytochrome P450 [Trametes maxima]